MNETPLIFACAASQTRSGCSDQPTQRLPSIPSTNRCSSAQRSLPLHFVFCTFCKNPSCKLLNSPYLYIFSSEDEHDTRLQGCGVKLCPGQCNFAQFELKLETFEFFHSIFPLSLNIPKTQCKIRHKFTRKQKSGMSFLFFENLVEFCSL